MAQSVAQRYPARTDTNGTTWYWSAVRKLIGRDGATADERQGWTSNPAYADPSYGVGDGQGHAFRDPRQPATPDPFDLPGVEA